MLWTRPLVPADLRPDAHCLKLAQYTFVTYAWDLFVLLLLRCNGMRLDRGAAHVRVSEEGSAGVAKIIGGGVCVVIGRRA